jgi:hypothetical protein
MKLSSALEHTGHPLTHLVSEKEQPTHPKSVHIPPHVMHFVDGKHM